MLKKIEIDENGQNLMKTSKTHMELFKTCMFPLEDL